MNSRSVILLVEDDPAASAALSGALASEGYVVRRAFSNSEALESLKKDDNPDLILLDRGLPDGDGLQLCLLLRKEPWFLDVPILFLTARGKAEEKVMGLRFGGDDYLVKPFSMEELKARVGALLRRTNRRKPARRPLFSSAGLTMDLLAKTVAFRGKKLPLRPTEYELLKFFMERPGEVLSRDLLSEAVWGAGLLPSARGALDMSISRLRKKLCLTGARIVTLKSRGYILTEFHKNRPAVR